jgi:hypothetical protein
MVERKDSFHPEMPMNKEIQRKCGRMEPDELSFYWMGHIRIPAYL